jgi:hypothetical protein
MSRLKSWIAQGRYKSFTTGKPMLLVLSKETGATILEPLYKTHKITNKTHHE